MKNTKLLALLSVSAILFLASGLQAEEKVDVVVGGLTNPCGVAVQPETGVVFVSDSGAGRIVRIQDGKAVEVITGFPIDVYGKGPKYNIGPLGLAFIDENTLVVGGGGQPDGEEILRIYTVPEAGKTIKAEDMKVDLGPLIAKDDIKGEGNFYAVAVSKSAIYVTCNGDDTKGWVAKANITKDGYSKFQRFIATKEAVEVDAPVGAALSPRGELVIGQMGEITVPNDSLLTFYNAKSGKMLMNLETSLFDITAVAYSPKGHLYALDFAWMNTNEGGLFRLDAETVDGEQAIKSAKITGLDKATAMAFGKDGALYITLIGTGEEKTGTLVKLAPGL